jgi:hypothetical protein
MVQVVDHLPSKKEALSSNPCTTKKKKEKRKNIKTKNTNKTNRLLGLINTTFGKVAEYKINIRKSVVF